MSKFATVPPTTAKLYYCNIVTDVGVQPIINELMRLDAESISNIKTFSPTRPCNIWFIAHGSTAGDDPL